MRRFLKNAGHNIRQARRERREQTTAIPSEGEQTTARPPRYSEIGPHLNRPLPATPLDRPLSQTSQTPSEMLPRFSEINALLPSYEETENIQREQHRQEAYDQLNQRETENIQREQPGRERQPGPQVSNFRDFVQRTGPIPEERNRRIPEAYDQLNQRAESE